MLRFSTLTLNSKENANEVGEGEDEQYCQTASEKGEETLQELHSALVTNV